MKGSQRHVKDVKEAGLANIEANFSDVWRRAQDKAHDIVSQAPDNSVGEDGEIKVGTDDFLYVKVSGTWKKATLT